MSDSLWREKRERMTEKKRHREEAKAAKRREKKTRHQQNLLQAKIRARQEDERKREISLRRRKRLKEQHAEERHARKLENAQKKMTARQEQLKREVQVKRQRKMAIELAEIRNRMRIMEERRREQRNAIKDYLASKSETEMQSKELQEKRRKSRKEIMQGGCLFPSTGTTYRSSLREVTHLISQNGIVVPVNTTSCDRADDQPDISCSDSAYEDT